MLEFRPRYRFEYPRSAAEVTQLIREHIRKDPACGLWVKDAHYHLTLNFPERGAHAWTPQMDINFEELGEGRTLIRCLIGPSPGIWMLFTAGYVGLILLGLTGLTLGFAQRSLGSPAWGSWALPVAVVGIGSLLFLSREGRRRSEPDMRDLKEAVDAALGCDCLSLADRQAQ
jgi:hypothetical protein